MITATDVRASGHRPNWLSWLRRELAPFPGRQEMTLRVVVTVVLVTIISMTLQVPQLAFSAFFIFFVTKENRALTLLTGVIMIVGATIASVASLFLYQYTFDYPELRIPVMAGFIFTGMFLSRVFVIGPLGFVIGFFAALMQTTAESAPNTEVLVRGVLWLWISIVYPIALTIFINQILLPADPWPALVRALTQRLDAATKALQRAIREGTAGGQTNPALLEMATRGSSPLLALLNFAESKDAVLKRRHESLFAAICASEHLLHATASLEFRERQELSPDDLVHAQELIAEIAEIRAVLPEHRPVLGPRKITESPAKLPQLRELQFATESFRDGLIRYITDDAQPTGPAAKKPLFIADAFTNPKHIQFALKVTLAAMVCYLIYSGLKWPGISTAFVTCCFIALENTEATMRKGWLRLIGCAVGGLFGYLAIIFLIPHMESIASLILLTAAWAALSGWVASGTDRISYAGLQAAFAFFMCIFQGYAPDTNFTAVRDRLLGIILGIIASSLVYRYIWPEQALDGLRAALARVLRNLAQSLLLPRIGIAIESEKKAASSLHTAASKDLDSTLRLSELVVTEQVTPADHEHISPAALEHITAHTQSLSLMTSALFAKTKLEDWQRLDPAAQQAELELRTRAADQLRQAAGFIETSRPIKSTDMEGAFAAWNRTVTNITDNDRPRLVRRVIQQVRQIS
ncbi:MAG TPA: FUSC family protein [Verrucomicrobiae bacterium]|nr:FUSC family protein [Verrucomicrobiae bacterium]